MEGNDCQVTLKHDYNGVNDSHLSPVEFVEVMVKNEEDSHMENMLRSTCPPIKFEPETSDDDDKQHVPFQNFQFVEVKNEVNVKNEIEVFGERSGTESEVFIPKPGDESSLMSSSDHIKIISTGDPNAGNFTLEIPGVTICGLTVIGTSLEKELVSESVKSLQTIEFQQKCVRLLVCPNCESFFYSPEALASHQSNCNFTNAPIEPVITPTLDSHNESQFPCTFCNKVLMSNYNLYRHLLTHTSERVYRCKRCDTTFMDKKQQAEHRKFHRSVQKLKCDLCGRILSDKSCLFNHKRIHAGVRPFSCKLCAKTFTSKKDLAIHSKFHTVERPYTCNECGKSFHQKGGLICHIRIHTGERPFRCDFCGKSFIQKSCLRVHVISHTGMGQFRCSYCSKRFAQKCHLEAHVVSHMGRTPICVPDVWQVI